MSRVEQTIRSAYEPLIRAGYVTRADLEREIADHRATSEKLARHECPKCSGPVTRQRDPRQVGASALVGTWFNYRCVSRCGFMLDRIEEPN